MKEVQEKPPAEGTGGVPQVLLFSPKIGGIKGVEKRL
jgi:hypothetical protein